MDAKHRRTYTGRSGQMAVMAELLDRGCNVAVPEVDVGRDLFAFLDEDADVTHLQIKTAGKPKSVKADGSYSAHLTAYLRVAASWMLPNIEQLQSLAVEQRPSTRRRIAAADQVVDLVHVAGPVDLRLRLADDALVASRRLVLRDRRGLAG